MQSRTIARGGRLVAALFALVLVVAACGDDGDSQDAAATTRAEHDGDHDETVDVSDLDPTPSVTVEVTEDPTSGWNLHAEVEGHEFAPESASTEAVDGEGHAHIYVDGEKLTRLYGEWYFLGDLEPGEREVRVELSANDHSPLAVDGAVVDDTVTIEVAGEEGTHEDESDDGNHEHEGGEGGDPVDASAADSTIEVVVTGGSAGGDTGRQEVAVGDTVLVRVTSDEADEVHVHGYDRFAAVAPGETAEIQFVADIPGVWEIELEGSGLLLAELAVS